MNRGIRGCRWGFRCRGVVQGVGGSGGWVGMQGGLTGGCRSAPEEVQSALAVASSGNGGGFAAAA